MRGQAEVLGHVLQDALDEEDTLRPAKAPEGCAGGDVSAAEVAGDMGGRLAVGVVTRQHRLL